MKTGPDPDRDLTDLLDARPPYDLTLKEVDTTGDDDLRGDTVTLSNASLPAQSTLPALHVLLHGGVMTL